jgi:hypothetical protein
MSDACGIHVFLLLDQTFDGWPIYILYAHFSGSWSRPANT